VIDPEGNQLGVMSPDQARAIATEHGLDLVEVAPRARPPVCRIMDYGKFKYDRAKRDKANSRASRVTIKTLRLRPNTGDHDLETKLTKALESLSSGDQVRLVMRMRGRERSVPRRWIERMDHILQRMHEGSDAPLKTLQRPKLEGRQITAMIEPIKNH